jgi:hypothetical protein
MTNTQQHISGSAALKTAHSTTQFEIIAFNFRPGDTNYIVTKFTIINLSFDFRFTTRILRITGGQKRSKSAKKSRKSKFRATFSPPHNQL